MVTEIADILARAGLDLTARELEDILWLASCINGPFSGDEPVALAEVASNDQGIDEPADEPDEADPRADQSVSTTAPSEPISPLYAKDVQGCVTGTTLRVGGLRHTPPTAALRRALQPFARRVPSRWQTCLDEEETVTRTFDTGVWMPVFRPVREHHFDLTMVIEDCTSAELREDTLRDLSRHFRNYSGLGRVRCYRLQGDVSPRLVDLDSEVEYSIEHLKDNHAGDRRHLVLFATDGTSPRWRNGGAQSFLHTVGASTCISVLHLLPRANWRRTLIGEPDVMLHCQQAGAPNTQFRTRLPWWVDADEVQQALPIPVLGMDAASMGTWVRAISALDGAIIPGVLVNRLSAPIASTLPATLADPVKLVARYRNIASASAYRLAVFLSKANPSTLSIMRLIQRTMLPNSGDGELAEFLLGGLVTRGEKQEGQAERLYCFRDGVAEELLKALRFSEEKTIVQQLSMVGQALEAENVQTSNLEVAFPTLAGSPSLSEWALPFATVSQKILRDHNRLDPTRPDLPIDSDKPAAVQAARTRLRVLHLSNLHFGAPQALIPTDKVSPFDILWHEHLSDLARNGRVDLVCVSGDLTWTASPDEFLKFEHFLNKTLEALRLPKSRLFVVPGNHDMRRDLDLRRANVRHQWPNGKVALTGLTGAEEAAVARAQSNYRAWLKRYLPHQYAATGDIFADYQLSLLGWAVPVRIVGIDSAWMTSIATGAVLSTKQMRHLETKSLDGITLAIMHHLPEQLKTPRNMHERLELAGVDLLLHGPDHKTESTIIMSRPSGLITSGVELSTRRDQPIAFHVIDCILEPGQGPALYKITVHEWLKQSSMWVAKLGENLSVETRAQTHSDPSISELALPPVFVGRNAEINRLHEILSTAWTQSNRPARLMISGETGVGKTALFHRCAREIWRDSTDHEDGYVVLNAFLDIDFEDELFKKMGGHSMESVLTRLRHRHTLLVIDDIDSPTHMSAAHRFAERWPECPVLLIGRFPLVGAAKSIGWDVMELAPLSAAESTSLLGFLLNMANTVVSRSDINAIVAALGGSPRLVGLVAAHLNETKSVAPLLGWLSADHAVDPLSRKHREAPDSFQWLLPALIPVFESRWRSQLDEEAIQILSALAYGPLSGFSTSLGLALSGLARRTANAASIRRFTYVCGRAVATGLLRKEGQHWCFKIPAVVAWLRTRGTKQGEHVMRRWSDWLAIRMAAPATSRTRSWDELNDLPNALIEWIDTCPPDAAELIRPVCMNYAVATGPLEAWEHLCRRILQYYGADHPASTDWYLTLAEFAHAHENLDSALSAVDRYLTLKRKTAKPGDQLLNAFYAATNLRNRILADRHDWSKFSMQPHSHVVNSVPNNDRPPELRPYQRALADAACAATLRAEPGTRNIGLVVQTLGSGASATLAAYLEACIRSDFLERSNIVVVVDRNDIARQLVPILQSRVPGIGIIEPRSVNELASLFRTKHTQIIVTTDQKIWQLQGTYASNWLVVGFALRRPSHSLIASLPEARMIIFGNESLIFKSSLTWRLGPIIASYRLEDAIRDDYLAPPNIVSYRLPDILSQGYTADRRAGDLNETAKRSLAEHILKDWFAREARLPDKRVLIVKNEDDALSLVEALSPGVASIDTKILLLTARMQFKQLALDEFRVSKLSTLLVTTAAMALGLPPVDIDVCYIAAKITPAIQLKIVSFSNSLGRERKIGEIFDFANNDWDILSLPI